MLLRTQSYTNEIWLMSKEFNDRMCFPGCLCNKNHFYVVIPFRSES